MESYPKSRASEQVESWGEKSMPTALGVPRRSPIQVLTKLNVA